MRTQSRWNLNPLYVKTNESIRWTTEHLKPFSVSQPPNVALLSLDVSPWSRTGIGVFGSVVILGGAVRTKESTTQEEEAGGPPADEESSSQLHLPSAHPYLVVEINDGVCRPAHGDEAHDARDDENHTGRHADFGFGALVLHAVGTLTPCHGKEDAKDADQDGDDGEGTGSLEVPGQDQQGVVDLTLHLACALHHAVHPDSLPNDLGRDNVLADEGCHPPLGKGADNDGPDPTDDAEGNARHLQAS